MRWIKVSERLPDDEGNYFVKVSGKEFFEETNDTDAYTSGGYYHFVNTFQGKYFPALPKNETVIEWLDESETPSDNQDELERTGRIIVSKLAYDTMQNQLKEKDKEIYYLQLQVKDLQEQINKRQ